MRWACGESAAPVAIRLPRRSASVLTVESARTAMTDVRSRSVSRMARARARRPRAVATRTASIHASGEFQAT
jgi:hypothetical protein